MAEHILFTGATGAFGKYIADNLLLANVPVTFLVRADSDESAAKRLLEVINIKAYPNTRHVLAGDLTKPRFGLNVKTYNELSQSITAVLHCAGSTRFNLSLPEATQANILPTRRLIAFAEKAGVKKFGYVSTAFLVGKSAGLIPELPLSPQLGFINTYDQTKYAAEEFVRTSKVPWTIYRPSLVIGDHTDRFNAALIVLGLASKGLLPVLPGIPTDQLDIIPADFAGQCIADIFMDSFIKDKVINVAMGKNAPTLSQILDIAKLPEPIRYCGHVTSDYDRAVKTVCRRHPELSAVYQRIDPFIRYLLFPKIFETNRFERAVRQADIPSITDVLPTITQAFNNA